MTPSGLSTSPFDLHAGALDETLEWLCAIPSPIGEEEAICDAVQARLSKLPLAAPIRRYGNSIVVPVTRGDGLPRVALVGHLDTVRTENGPARIENGRCYGAGASDMKSGLAVMICVAEVLSTVLKCELTLVFYAKEEGPFSENELGVVLAEDPELAHVDLAVCLEPSNNLLHVGCTGSIHATVTVQGRTSHSARPWEGENAITRAAPLLAKIGAIKPEEHVIEGHIYRSVYTVTQAKDGGRGRNVVPDRFVINVNHRFAPDTTLDEAEYNLRTVIGDAGQIEITDLSPPAMPNAEHPLVLALIAAGVKGVEPKQAWTDVARFAQKGIRAVNFGPGENAQAHQKDESTSLALVHEGFAIVKRWLTSLGPSAIPER